MKEIYRSPSMAELSAVQAFLESANIDSIMFDYNASFIYGPSAYLSPRLMVADDDYERAFKILKEAGFGN